MTITYEYDDSLYINLTNRCDCSCVFCIRQNGAGEALFDDSLWLPREPTQEEALEDILSRDLSSYRELVFCGYGEPTYRIDTILWLCDELRARVPNLPKIRLNTNGHGSLLNNRNIAPSLHGRIDVVSISLNSPHPDNYCAITRPRDGIIAWESMLNFVRESVRFVPEVILTVVNQGLSEEDLRKSHILAKSLGATLRIREYSS